MKFPTLDRNIRLSPMQNPAKNDEAPATVESLSPLLSAASVRMLFSPLTLIFHILFIAVVPDLVQGAQNLQFSMGLPHYATEMEFYYQRPRPERLPALLENFQKNGLLRDAEKRMMVAAFLAGADKGSPGLLAKLAGDSENLSREMRHILAWSAALAQNAYPESFIRKLLKPDEEALARQILGAPRSLRSWNPEGETSILQMYWAMFMATGEKAWLDAIIGAACDYARESQAGTASRKLKVTGIQAAATLHEYAKRHAAVRERINYFMERAKGPELEMLLLINGKK